MTSDEIKSALAVWCDCAPICTMTLAEAPSDIKWKLNLQDMPSDWEIVLLPGERYRINIPAGLYPTLPPLTFA